jgi:hypothetical protein
MKVHIREAMKGRKVYALHCKCRAGEDPKYCKCLVPIYVFPEIKLSSLIISKTEL